jgi:hypothetical protein
MIDIPKVGRDYSPMPPTPEKPTQKTDVMVDIPKIGRDYTPMPETPEKPVAPIINFYPLGVKRPKKTKTWAQAVQPPAPLNLENEFDTEVQAYDGIGSITQAEMDWAWEQMEIQRERDNEHLISIDGRYVQSLEQDNEMLRAQMSYFQNLYYAESIKCKAVIDTFKGGNVTTPYDMV